MTRRWRVDSVTWLGWVAAGALGGATATVLGLLGVPSSPNDQGELATLAHFLTYAAVVSTFQFVVLGLVGHRSRAALLWVPAALVGTYLWLDVVWFPWFPADEFIYPLALGAAQGAVLALMTRRWVSLPLWLVANVVAWPVTGYVGHLYVGPLTREASLVASVTLTNATGAAVTGLALVLILRLGRRTSAPAAPKIPAPGLQGQG